MATVLFLTQVLPYPLDSGAKIRAYYVLQHLASQHEVTLVSFVRADDRPAWVEHLRGFCDAVHTVPMRRSPLLDGRALLKAVLRGEPAVIVRDEMGEMFSTLRRLADEQSFDIVHADQTSMAQYALYAQAMCGRRPKAVLDVHNALYRVPQRLAAQEGDRLKKALLQREALALARYERRTYARFDHLVFVADQDRGALVGQAPGDDSPSATCTEPSRSIGHRPSAIIPICVDVGEKPLLELVSDRRAITHLGTMFWPPNIEGVLWFAGHVFPHVVQAHPSARLTIVGKDPPEAVRRLAIENPSVDVTGWVEDPRPLLAQTSAFIVPLLSAGGMRVKILDAWSWGLPIVSTSIGAEGIDVQDGHNILLADGAESFARCVLRLLQEPDLGERLRHNGRCWVEEQYDWRRVYAQWDEVYQRLMTP